MTTELQTDVRGGCSVQRLVGRHSWCVLYHADCLDVLKELQSVDAVITDPPYGIGYQPEPWGKTNPKVKKTFLNGERVGGDDESFDPAAMLGLAPTIVLWGGSNFAGSLPSTRGWLVWDKKCGIYETNKFSDCELAWTNRDAPIKIFRHRWTGYHRDSERGETRLHLTQKPVVVMAWCMEQVGVPLGATVLDPYMGSGTTGIACLRTGRNFIGIERDAAHYKTACDRIAHELDGALL